MSAVPRLINWGMGLGTAYFLKKLNGMGGAAASARVRGLVLLAVCALALSACAFRDKDGYVVGTERNEGPQQFPQDYRVELLAFMRSYLNDPTGIKEAFIAEPAQRTVSGHLRYVVCLSYSARDGNGDNAPARVRAVLYVQGRLDKLIEDGVEICEGASYAPFPDMERLTR